MDDYFIDFHVVFSLFKIKGIKVTLKTRKKLKNSSSPNYPLRLFVVAHNKASQGQNWSQDELAKGIDSSPVMIDKYERCDNLPTFEVILNLAKAFDVSVHFLLVEGLNAAYVKEMVKLLNELEHLPEDEKQRVFHYMYLIIRD